MTMGNLFTERDSASEGNSFVERGKFTGGAPVLETDDPSLTLIYTCSSN